MESSDTSDDVSGELASLTAQAQGYDEDREALCDLLGSLLDDDEQMRLVVDDAAFHPNGFAKIPLGLRNGHRLRLHVWPVGGWQPVAGPNPHGHRWPFASWIITGALRETNFEARPDDGLTEGIRADHLHYGRRPDGTPFMTHQGSAVLVPCGSPIREAGTVYTRMPDDLHSADPLGEDLVASLVVQGERRNSSTSVYQRHGRPEPAGRPLTERETRTLLEQIIDVLRKVRR